MDCVRTELEYERLRLRTLESSPRQDWVAITLRRTIGRAIKQLERRLQHGKEASRQSALHKITGQTAPHIKESLHRYRTNTDSNNHTVSRVSVQQGNHAQVGAQ